MENGEVLGPERGALAFRFGDGAAEHLLGSPVRSICP